MCVRPLTVGIKGIAGSVFSFWFVSVDSSSQRLLSVGETLCSTAAVRLASQVAAPLYREERHSARTLPVGALMQLLG